MAEPLTCGICGLIGESVYPWDDVNLCGRCAKEMLDPGEYSLWLRANAHHRTIERRRSASG